MKQNRQHYYPELGGPPSITQQWLYTFKVDTPLSTLKHHALNDKWYYQSQKRKKYERKKKIAAGRRVLYSKSMQIPKNYVFMI